MRSATRIDRRREQKAVAKRRGLRPQLIALAAAASVGLLWWMWPEGVRGDVRHSLEALVEAAEEGRRSEVRAWVAEDYADVFGQDADEAVRRAFDALSQYRAPRIVLSGLDIAIGDDEQSATTSFRVAVEGDGTPNADLRALEQHRKLVLHWVLRSQTWRVKRAEVRFGLF